jgi:hypothetical protein
VQSKAVEVLRLHIRLQWVWQDLTIQLHLVVLPRQLECLVMTARQN